jgi:hypothetical protein
LARCLLPRGARAAGGSILQWPQGVAGSPSAYELDWTRPPFLQTIEDQLHT